MIIPFFEADKNFCSKTSVKRGTRLGRSLICKSGDLNAD